MLNKAKLLWSTVRHLKPTQIKYQMLYRLKKPGKLSNYSATFSWDKIIWLDFKGNPPVYSCLSKNLTFTFLNKSKQFEGDVDWNFQEFGRLWNYNLQYGNFLLQEDISIQVRIELILSLYRSLQDGRLALEPYPASLRIMNLIRFISTNKIKHQEIIEYLSAEVNFLYTYPEYHLLGNHLLENGFALMMGGAFFNQSKWIEKGKRIVKAQLTEQILDDGGHFELSPMYHQIILFRVLEMIDWYSNHPHKDKVLDKQLVDKGTQMLTWLQNVTYSTGDIPHFNDSADGVAYASQWLLDFGKTLGLNPSSIELGESGFRAVNFDAYECRIDIGQLGAQYQPGHAHADALSFVLYASGKPIFVEVGTSTYEANAKRQYERSTKAHNTVVIGDSNQSQVYGGFRVGERAKTQIDNDSKEVIVASHDGYKKKYGVIHTRKFSFHDSDITLEDSLNRSVEAKAYFHIYPEFDIKPVDQYHFAISDLVIGFEEPINIDIVNYQYSNGFNSSSKALCLVVTFKERLVTKIDFKP